MTRLHHKLRDRFRGGLLGLALMGCSASQPALDLDSDNEVETTPAEDAGDGACTIGESRCSKENILQRCDEGVWEDWEDCAALNMTCLLLQGEHRCFHVGDTETDTGADTDSGSAVEDGGQDASSDTGSDTHRDIGTDSATDTQTDGLPEDAGESDTGSGSETDHPGDTSSDSDTATASDTQTDTQTVDSETGTGPDTGTGTESDSASTDTDSETATETVSDTVTETDETDTGTATERGTAPGDSETIEPDAGATTDPDRCATDDPCGDHGTCEDSPTGPLCDCDSGWTGDLCDECAPGFHPDGDVCRLDESCLPTSCAGHGECDVVEGLVACTCTDGANWDPSTYCAECVMGYFPEGDVCVPYEVCGLDNEPCVNGTCAVVDGLVTCSCRGDWTGLFCNTCSPGNHVEGTDCVPDRNCRDDNTCVNGTCDDLGGIITCDCDPSWGGSTCDTCAVGYHPSADGEGCELDETCIPTSCAGNGTCSINASGYVECECAPGENWDPDSYCAACLPGFHEVNGACVADRSCASDDNCLQGTCVDNPSGTDFTCACDPYWEGDTCDTCIYGFQDLDGDGSCHPDCGYTGAPDCLNGGVCQVNLETGYAECDCAGATPWFGARCDLCPEAVCNGQCCGAGQVCSASDGACCTPATCDTFGGQTPECGFTVTVDTCTGAPVDCGDCGSFGYCSGGSCQCLEAYGVPDGTHECLYACDGYLPSAGCCENDVHYFCNGQDLEFTDCFSENQGSGPPLTHCGFDSGYLEFMCGGEDTPEPYGYTTGCPDNIVPQCDDDGEEENDTLNTARPIVINELNTGLHACPGDDDWFVLGDVDSGNGITVDLAFLHDAGNLDLYLYGADGTLLTSSESTDDGESLSHVTQTSGDYYILVKGFSGTVENSYTLRTSACVNDVFDSQGSHNDDYTAAVPISSGVLSDLMICEGIVTADEDWFEITAGNGDTIAPSIFFNHSEGDLNLYLYASPPTVALAAGDSTDDNESLQLTAPSSGTYYLQVVGVSPDVRNDYDLALLVTP